MLRIVSEEEFQRIEKAHILLIGVGGVGGYVLESLLRSGVSHITVVDCDVFEASNLNRQVLSLQETIGLKKTDVALTRAKQIRPDVHINTIYQRLTLEDITSQFVCGYDYIIDACDDVLVKAELMRVCSKDGIALISCMGTGNRFHPEMLEFMRLDKTSYDPLSKKLRHELKGNKEALKTIVLCSKEAPVKGCKLGTICSLPMAAGAMIASYVINELKKRELSSLETDIG